MLTETSWEWGTWVGRGCPFGCFLLILGFGAKTGRKTKSSTSIFFKLNISVWTNHTPRAPPNPPTPPTLGLFQAVTVWLTEIPEIQADGSSPWLMMSQADPFLCPPRSNSNPPQFSYVFHDKSHHAFLLTFLSPHYSFGPVSSTVWIWAACRWFWKG